MQIFVSDIRRLATAKFITGHAEQGQGWRKFIETNVVKEKKCFGITYLSHFPQVLRRYIIFKVGR